MLGLFNFYQVPQGHAVVVERFGQFDKVLQPGLNWVNPLTSTHKNLGNWGNIASKSGYLMELTEQHIETSQRQCNTKDNVTVSATAYINFKIVDPEKAVYAIDELPKTIENVCLNVLRSQIGQFSFDEIFAKRGEISKKVAAELDSKVNQWGINLIGVEVGGLVYDPGLYRALQQKRIAEAEKEAKVVAIEAAALSAIKEREGQLKTESVEATIKKLKAETEASNVLIRARANAEAKEAEEAAKTRTYVHNKDAERAYLQHLIDQVGKDKAVEMMNTQRIVDGMTTFSNNPSNKVIMLPNDFKGFIKLVGNE